MNPLRRRFSNDRKAIGKGKERASSMPGHERNWCSCGAQMEFSATFGGSRRPVGRLVFDRDIADFGKVRAAIEAFCSKALPIQALMAAAIVLAMLALAGYG